MAIEISLREALPEDALELQQVCQKMSTETTFVLLDQLGMNLSVTDLATQLELLRESPQNLLLLACDQEKIVGIASVLTDAAPELSHIGQVGISILQEYWGLGLGRLMLEELQFWAQDTQHIRRLELIVQARNERAIRLYQSAGFILEATMARGFKTVTGEFLDVLLMSQLID